MFLKIPGVIFSDKRQFEIIIAQKFEEKYYHGGVYTFLTFSFVLLIITKKTYAADLK